MSNSEVRLQKGLRVVVPNKKEIQLEERMKTEAIFGDENSAVYDLIEK